MTDTLPNETVFRLIYRSHSRLAPNVRREQLGNIFSVARSANKKIGVTGALLITDDEFVQTLEGPEPVVRDLYAKIGRDGRHERVELLDTQHESERVFAKWAMAKVAADGEPDIPLLTNANKGGISPAQPGAGPTDAQQRVLDVMHQALRDANAAR